MVIDVINITTCISAANFVIILSYIFKVHCSLLLSLPKGVITVGLGSKGQNLHIYSSYVLIIWYHESNTTAWTQSSSYYHLGWLAHWIMMVYLRGRRRLNRFYRLPCHNLKYVCTYVNLDCYIFVCTETQLDDTNVPVT